MNVPIIARATMDGNSTAFGNRSTLTKRGIASRFTSTSMRLLTCMLAMMPQANCGCCSNNSGPGRRPKSMRPPSITAVVADPRSPSVRSGTRAPRPTRPRAAEPVRGRGKHAAEAESRLRNLVRRGLGRRREDFGDPEEPDRHGDELHAIEQLQLTEREAGQTGDQGDTDDGQPEPQQDRNGALQLVAPGEVHDQAEPEHEEAGELGRPEGQRERGERLGPKHQEDDAP